MILPVIAYGDPVLKKKAEEIDENYPNLKELIENMFETMYASNGVGIAAPQIGRSIRLFVIDASAVAEGDDGDPSCEDFKRVFINPIIFEESGTEWSCEEGCLSIPRIREGDGIMVGGDGRMVAGNSFDVSKAAVDGPKTTLNENQQRPKITPLFIKESVEKPQSQSKDQGPKPVFESDKENEPAWRKYTRLNK